MKEVLDSVRGVAQTIRENGLALTLATVLLSVGLYHTWRLDERHNELQGEVRTLLVNQIAENSKSLSATSEALKSACEQGSATRKAVEKNTQVLSRIERILEARP